MGDLNRHAGLSIKWKRRYGPSGSLPLLRGVHVCIIKEFISSLTFLRPAGFLGQALPSAVNGPVPCRPPGPCYARNFKSQISNLKSEICHLSSRRACPRPSGLATRSPNGYLLMNSLVVRHAFLGWRTLSERRHDDAILLNSTWKKQGN